MVLVVDDEPETLLVLKSALEAAGYRPLLAADAETARRRLGDDRPDVVIVDPAMPGGDGWDLLRSGDLGPDVAVIALSRPLSDDDRARASAAGARAHVAKPFDAGDIVELVGRTLTAGGGPSGDG